MRIIAYNLWFGGRDRQDAIHDVLAHCNADFIGLTEADDPQVIAALAQKLNMTHVWARGSGDRHIAALSRFPIRDWHIYNKPPLTQAVLEVTLDIDPPLTIYVVHLLPYLLLPFEVRRWQAVGKLLQIIKEKGIGRHILLGDFNCIAPNDRVLQDKNPEKMRRLMRWQFGHIFRFAMPRLLKAGYTDCFRHLHPNDDGFTWWTINPTTRYDYILATADLLPALQSCRVIDDHPAVPEASDHFPLSAEFNLTI
ncbi:MAG: endonuclease/exonuclease/phosphatase family protein [Candidatus Promineifilaceae bacterium]